MAARPRRSRVNVGRIHQGPERPELPAATASERSDADRDHRLDPLKSTIRSVE